MISAPHNRACGILVVDDDVSTRLLLKIFLDNFGFEVDSADGPGEALRCFNPEIHHLVLTDNSMPGMTGVELSRIIKMRAPATAVLMCSGNPPDQCSSVDVIIKKPTSLLVIRDQVERLLMAAR